MRSMCSILTLSLLLLNGFYFHLIFAVVIKLVLFFITFIFYPSFYGLCVLMHVISLLWITIGTSSCVKDTILIQFAIIIINIIIIVLFICSTNINPISRSRLLVSHSLFEWCFLGEFHHKSHIHIKWFILCKYSWSFWKWKHAVHPHSKVSRKFKRHKK